MLELKRVTIFTRNMIAMTAFYRDVLGLVQRTDEKGFKEFSAGGCTIALHNGGARVGARPPKLAFWAVDVAETRGILVGRGAKLGEVLVGRGLTRCEGKDPDGNPYQISDRR